jgi:hypothetical protein
MMAEQPDPIEALHEAARRMFAAEVAAADAAHLKDLCGLTEEQAAETADKLAAGELQVRNNVVGVARPRYGRKWYPYNPYSTAADTLRFFRCYPIIGVCPECGGGELYLLHGDDLAFCRACNTSWSVAE